MDYTQKVDPTNGMPYLAMRRRGRALLLEPLTNKGTGFSR